MRSLILLLAVIGFAYAYQARDESEFGFFDDVKAQMQESYNEFVRKQLVNMVKEYRNKIKQKSKALFKTFIRPKLLSLRQKLIENAKGFVEDFGDTLKDAFANFKIPKISELNLEVEESEITGTFTQKIAKKLQAKGKLLGEHFNSITKKALEAGEDAMKEIGDKLKARGATAREDIESVVDEISTKVVDEITEEFQGGVPQEYSWWTSTRDEVREHLKNLKNKVVGGVKKTREEVKERAKELHRTYIRPKLLALREELMNNAEGFAKDFTETLQETFAKFEIPKLDLLNAEESEEEIKGSLAERIAHKLHAKGKILKDHLGKITRDAVEAAEGAMEEIGENLKERGVTAREDIEAVVEDISTKVVDEITEGIEDIEAIIEPEVAPAA
jgi:hypothetical protein